MSQQEEGHAYWIYRGHAQQVQTMVPITEEQFARGRQEIRRQEEMHQKFLEAEDVRPDVQQGQKQANIATDEGQSQQHTPSLSTQQEACSSSAKKKKESVKKIQQSSQQAVSNSSPEPGQILPPARIWMMMNRIDFSLPGIL